MSGTAKISEHGSESPNGIHRSLAGQIAVARETGLLGSPTGTGTTPLSFVLVFDSEARRDFVRRRLIERDVPAAAIGPSEDAEASGETARLLSLSGAGDDGQATLARAAAIALEADREYESLATPDAKSAASDTSNGRQQPQRTVEAQHDDWPHFISAQASPVWGHRYRRQEPSRS